MRKIATWNVNSLKVRLPQVLEWLTTHQPDVLALQETKLLDENFPHAEITALGYESVFSGQKTYNGVAILSKQKTVDCVMDFEGLGDPQRRVLAGTIGDIRIINLYVPNGESVGSEKYLYKLNWLSHLELFLEAELKRYPKMVILGDFNIAPEDIDVHEPMLWDGRVLVSEGERKAFKRLLDIGFFDTFRLLSPTEKVFSWWDYRLNAFRRNMGLRIDHILVSSALRDTCQRCYIDKVPRAVERPSDHTPVVVEF